MFKVSAVLQNIDSSYLPIISINSAIQLKQQQNSWSNTVLLSTFYGVYVGLILSFFFSPHTHTRTYPSNIIYISGCSSL